MSCRRQLPLRGGRRIDVGPRSSCLLGNSRRRGLSPEKYFSFLAPTVPGIFQFIFPVGLHWKAHIPFRYLDVIIDSKLNFNEHVNHISKKATTRAFVHRNTSSCPMKVKALAYKTFVRPQLEYASSVWAPHTHCNIDRIEAVQRRAAIYNERLESTS